jgi:hypothetical protein
MAKTVLLFGVKAELLKKVNHERQPPGIPFLAGTGEADAGLAFREADIDHVIIGGLDLRPGAMKLWIRAGHPSGGCLARPSAVEPRLEFPATVAVAAVMP